MTFLVNLQSFQYYMYVYMRVYESLPVIESGKEKTRFDFAFLVFLEVLVCTVYQETELVSMCIHLMLFCCLLSWFLFAGHQGSSQSDNQKQVLAP